MNARRSQLLIALAGLTLAGCKRHPSPPLVLDRLSVSEESLSASPALGLGADGVRQQVEAALKQQGVLLLGSGQAPPAETKPFRLRAEVERAYLEDVRLPDGGVGQDAEVQVALEVSRSTSEGTYKVGGSGTGRAPAPPAPELDGQGAAFKLAFQRATELASASLVRRVAASNRSVGELHEDLKSPDAGVREAAADVLVDHHDAAAVPVLVTELDSDDDDVRMKAIGELVEMRAKEAVPKLIDLAQTRDPNLGGDPHFQMQIIYALGSIGGEEAEAYLYTIASGHPDEMVRNAAREASSELRASRKSTAGKAP